MHTADVNPPNNIIVCSKVKLIIPYVQIKQKYKVMKLKLLVLFILAGVLSNSLLAKAVNVDTACAVATNFFAMKYHHCTESLKPVIAYSATSVQDKSSSRPSYYVVNFDSKGFVIVSGDDRIQPILAYSNEGPFVAENIPSHIRFFLDGYTAEIQYIIDNQQTVDKSIQQKWKTLLSGGELNPKDGEVVVAPLLGNNKWSQTKYYNDLCPADASGDPAYGGHAAVGCGALVMGQVMRYWQFPLTGTGSHSYNSNNYGLLSANFGATSYHYENMPDKLYAAYHPDSCVEAVAILLYHCGVAVNMNYGPSASISNSNRIVSALSTYFCFPTTIQYIERGNISSNTWINYLKNELDEGAPFMYGGSGSYGGHVWICDGYQDDNYFHFNWGWGGQQNGFYSLANCSSYGFNSNHAIIVGIRGPELPEAIGEHHKDNISIFPNPSNGIVQVRTEQQPMNELQVFDLFGKKLFHKNVGQKETSVDLSGYSTGTYILRISCIDGVKTIKVLKN